MTSARSNLSTDMILARIGAGLRQAFHWTLRGLLALSIVFMAGVFAVITAAVGLIIAAVAVFLKLTGTTSTRRKSSERTHTDEAGITLEAHRTARGWTVE